VLVDGEDAGPERVARAAGEDAEVIGVFEILCEHNVAHVEQSGELPNGKIPDSPGVLKLVGETGVEDEAPPGRRGLINRA
jgi:hypothetical protein